MKRTLLKAALVPLSIVEVWIAIAFLPEAWQTKLTGVLAHAPDYSTLTHPALDREIQQALGGYAWIIWMLWLALLLANTFLISRVLRALQNHPARSSRLR